MPDMPIRLAERLRAEGEKTRAFFSALTREQWNQEIYTEGSCWSVRQVLAHFVASESSMARLVQNIQAGGLGSPEDFDLDAYNERKVAGLNEASSAELLDKFTELRQQFADLVDRMSLVDLGKSGRHPFLGMASLEDIVKLVYRHNQIHLRDVRRVVG
jgi:hypothetical protein